jgi:hypothetical protein
MPLVKRIAATVAARLCRPVCWWKGHIFQTTNYEGKDGEGRWCRIGTRHERCQRCGKNYHYWIDEQLDLPPRNKNGV